MTQDIFLDSLGDHVFEIRLERPERMNALGVSTLAALQQAVTDAAAQRARVLLIRGSGRAFCAGADLKERKGMSSDEVRTRRMRGFAAYGALESLAVPVVAVVHGAAIGSGSEIAAACDFIVATPEASFATPEAIWGTVGATQRLPRVLGKRLAKDMMFTGRKLTAEEARAAGLVTRIVPADQLDAALAELAQTIGKASASGLRQAKRAIDQGFELDPRGAMTVELLAIEENLAQEEWRTRMAGFKSAT